MAELLNDSMLEDVNGGFDAGGFWKLPSHTCGNSQTGELKQCGPFLGTKTRYECVNCHRKGRIRYVNGTRQYCELF